jgi:hypothetical protein
MAHIRQSTSDSGLGFQVKDHKIVRVVPSSLVSGGVIGGQAPLAALWYERERKRESARERETEKEPARAKEKESRRKRASASARETIKRER